MEFCQCVQLKSSVVCLFLHKMWICNLFLNDKECILSVHFQSTQVHLQWRASPWAQAGTSVCSTSKGRGNYSRLMDFCLHLNLLVFFDNAKDMSGLEASPGSPRKLLSSLTHKNLILLLCWEVKWLSLVYWDRSKYLIYQICGLAKLWGGVGPPICKFWGKLESSFWRCLFEL